jgi:hypothetical protein
MVEVNAVLAAARDAYARRDWPAAREGFDAAREVAALSADDLSALGDAAWWLGHIEESLAASEQAYHGYLDAGQPRQAAMAALGVAYLSFLRGREAVGTGWMSRAQRLVADQPECVEQGYLLYVLQVEAALDGPDVAAVVAAARGVRELGRRHGDPTLGRGGDPRRGPDAGPPRAGRGGPGAAGRGDGRGAVRGAHPGVGGQHLLPHDGGLPRAVRHRPRAGVDRGHHPLAGHPARRGAVHRDLPGPPLPGPANHR